MTLKEIQLFEQAEEDLTLPDSPEQYLEVTFYDSHSVHIEEFEESYPVAVSDVTTEDVLDYKKLTVAENVKEVYQIELSTSFKFFKPGDTIGIITKNREEDVQKIFYHLQIPHLSSKKCTVTEKSVPSKKNNSKPAFINKVTTLHHIFTYCLDIYCVPKKAFIRLLSDFTSDSKQKRQLRELSSKEKSDLYVKNILETNKTFLDLLLAHPSCCPPIARIIEHLPKLMPRPYSIASSPLKSPNSVRVIFSVVRNDCDGTVREGLCTGMLKELLNDRNKPKRVKMFFRRSNTFNLPETNVPLIFVGPGTGISPFIEAFSVGFLEHRHMTNTKGIVWLFYGCRSRTGDFLFEKELQKYKELGVLTKLCVAFSRESDSQAKYVQDNIRLNGKELCQLIFERGGVIYVCGDAKNMRKEIKSSFIDIFENYKGMTNKEATDHVKKLEKEKRYLQDIWN